MAGCETYAHETNELLIAYGLVGLVNGRRTVRRASVAKTRVPASVVVATLVPESQPAVGLAAWTLYRREAKINHPRVGCIRREKLFIFAAKLCDKG